MDIVQRVTLGRTKLKKLPDFGTGDTIGVYVRVKEGEKERVQLYRGVVLKITGSGMGKTFTVRKISSGVGVERIFPFASPAIDRVEVISRGKVRRSRLFYLRGLKGRAARVNSELVIAEGEDIGAADDITLDPNMTAEQMEAAKSERSAAKKAEKAAKKEAHVKEKKPAKK